jgi:hypothetical protein
MSLGEMCKIIVLSKISICWTGIIIKVVKCLYFWWRSPPTPAFVSPFQLSVWRWHPLRHLYDRMPWWLRLDTFIHTSYFILLNLISKSDKISILTSKMYLNKSPNPKNQISNVLISKMLLTNIAQLITHMIFIQQQICINVTKYFDL